MEVPTTVIFLLLSFANLLVLGESSVHHNNDFLECLIMHSENRDSAIFDAIYTPTYESLLLAPNLRPVATSPHDFEGLSFASESPFIVVDMRNLRSISVNVEEKTAWVLVGAMLGELYHAIAQKSKTLGITAGVASTVGVGGHLSGGGYGMMSRKHSIASDNIIDAKIINADGQILDRKSMRQDLFWALKGSGGASFGILLAFKVKLVIVPEIVTVFNVSRTLEQNATQLVHRWQLIADKIDENLSIRLFLSSVSSSTNENRRTTIATFTSLFLGRIHDLLPIMQEKFMELGLVEQDCIEMSWIESVLFFGGLHNQSIDALLSRTL